MSGGLHYIREHYKVPATRGSRVKFTDELGVIWNGRITSGRNGKLRVLVDDRVPGYRRRLILHPTWRVEYLPNKPSGNAT